MKKTLALMTMLVGLAATPAMAMSVDDILELCRAGFDGDRIARIVEAAGMEKPLEAADWSRIKTEGCGDEVVDALLNVLAPAEADEEYDDDSYDDGDVDVNLYGQWGTNGWYGSAFWGGYSPSWGFGYSSYDPFWDWSWRWHWTGGYSWYDPWWCYPHRPAYYCHTWYSPYYYCGGGYTGGYYSGGVYERQKASRQGGSAKAYRYASAKTSTVATQATYASAKAKPYRGGAVATGMTTSGGVAVKKSSRTSMTTAGGTTYTKTKGSSAERGSAVGVGTTTTKQKGTSTTVRTDNGTVKSKSTVRNGGATSTGNSTSVTRSKTKTGASTGTSTGTSTTVKRKSSGATSTGKAPATTAPGKSSGSSYRAPSSTSAPAGGATHRSGSGTSGGTARVKGGKK